jgi:hypothetical protein
MLTNVCGGLFTESLVILRKWRNDFDVNVLCIRLQEYDDVTRQVRRAQCFKHLARIRSEYVTTDNGLI